MGRGDRWGKWETEPCRIEMVSMRQGNRKVKGKIFNRNAAEDRMRKAARKSEGMMKTDKRAEDGQKKSQVKEGKRIEGFIEKQ